MTGGLRASLATINADSTAPPVVTSGIAHGRAKPVDLRWPPSSTGVGNLIVREVAEQKLGVFQREVEDDGAQAGNDTDRDSREHLRRCLGASRHCRPSRRRPSFPMSSAWQVEVSSMPANTDQSPGAIPELASAIRTISSATMAQV